VVVLLGVLLADGIGSGFGQPAPSPPAMTPPATPESTPTSSPTPPPASVPIKEIKETKEIKDHPSDWVEFSAAIAWPLCLLLIVLVLLFSRTGKRIFGLFPKVVRKINAGGVEMEINADAVEEIREYLRDSFDELVARAKDEYQRMASVQQITMHLSSVMDNALPRVLTANSIPNLPANVRARFMWQTLFFPATFINWSIIIRSTIDPEGVPTAVSRNDSASLDARGDLVNQWVAGTRSW
jgi:hypothetical protein